MYKLPDSFIRICQQAPDFQAFPLPEKRPTDSLKAFFAQPAITAFYKEVSGKPQANDALQAVASLLPQLPPYRAAQLAFLCGALIENGACPTTIFTVCCNLLDHLTLQVLPYCANDFNADKLEETPSQGNENDAQELQQQEYRLKQAQQNLESLAPLRRLEITSLQHAIDMMVPPLMTMLMRDQSNMLQFNERHELIANLQNIVGNITLPFNDLHFLTRASELTYSEFVVILPTSLTGFVAKAHGINNVFHAITLLQDIMATHADELQIGIIDPALTRCEQAMHTRYNWYNAQAFEQGQLAYPMALAWGEVPLRYMPQKLRDVVLYAVETHELAPQRQWNESFSAILHNDQNPGIEFLRALHPHEVQGYLQ